MKGKNHVTNEKSGNARPISVVKSCEFSLAQDMANGVDKSTAYRVAADGKQNVTNTIQCGIATPSTPPSSVDEATALIAIMYEMINHFGHFEIVFIYFTAGSQNHHRKRVAYYL